MVASPKVGIIVPVYKTKREYFDMCIQSLIHQTYQNLQIILVDDCSPDQCGEWCDSYASTDKRIEVYHHEHNQGVSGARNTGIRHAHCDWITFVDSDDWLDIDTIEKALTATDALAEQPDVIMYQGAMEYRYSSLCDRLDHGRIWRTKEERDQLQILAMSIPTKNYPSNRIIAYDMAGAKFIATQLLQKNNIKFQSFPYREDGMFFQELVEVAGMVVEVTSGTYHYRMTEGSAVHTFRQKAVEEQRMFLTAMCDFAKVHHKSPEYIQMLYAVALISMQVCITTCFFNSNNPDGYWARHRYCRKVFSEQPYCDIFKYVKLRGLKRNFLIKAVCMRLRWYSGVVLLRNLYSKKNQLLCFD